MSDPDTTTPPRTEPPTKTPSKRDRLIKTAFLVVALGIVAWKVIQPQLTIPLPGWTTDLPAALAQAKATGRKLVVIMYDNPQNHTYKNKLRTIVSKEQNREAMDEADMLRVQARLKKEDPLAKRFGVRSFPTTLLLSSEGELITRWVGNIGEVEFRQRFLKGERQHPLAGWTTDLPAALAQAEADRRKLVVLVYDTPQNDTYQNELRTVVSKQENRQAMDRADVLRVEARLAEDDPLAQRFDITSFPTTLLLSPDGEVITRWVGGIDETDFRERFLEGDRQPAMASGPAP